MVFKVSFKDTPKNPSVIINKAGRTTTVYLRGTVRLPEFWSSMPDRIFEWIEGVGSVEVYEHLADNTLSIYAKGVSRCREDDKYDSLLGERLAEARAKCAVYKFFHDLTYKLSEYYGGLLYGSSCVVDSCDEGIMADVVKYERLYRRELQHQRDLIRKDEDG